MPGYELTADADSDLEEIIRYTFREWGENQTRAYAQTLEDAFEKIARKEAVSRHFSSKYPQALVTRCEHHYIFYLHPEGEKPRIFAVLHERMDMLARLMDRLA